MLDAKVIAELRELRKAASGPNGVEAAVEYQRKLNEALPALLDAAEKYFNCGRGEEDA